MFVRRMSLMVALLMLVALSSCLKQGGTRLAVNNVSTNLTLNGSVLLSDGRSAPGINIYADEIETSLGVTDDNGGFSLILTDDQLNRLAAVQDGTSPASGRNVFRLWVEGGDISPMVGVSNAIETARRGEHQLAAIILQPAANVSGKVMVVSSGRRPEDAQGASIKIGRRTAVAGEGGRFQIERAPAGQSSIVTSFNGYQTDIRLINIQAGEQITLPFEIVLFPEETVGGAVFLDDRVSVADLVRAGHPFLRAFRAIGSSNARYIRYHHDATSLTSDPSVAPWRPIPERFEHDFPQDAGHTLFYQFADTEQVNTSEIYRIQVVIDQFAESRGCSIEDGSGVINSRKALIRLDVPPAAFRMRIAETIEALRELPWENAAPITTHVFELRRSPESLQLEVQGLRNLFCQFRDANGLEGPIYQTSVVIDQFPIQGTPFVIDGGSPIATDRIVRLDIQVPPNAYEMRIFENLLTGTATAFDISAAGAAFGTSSINYLSDKIWLAAQPTYYKVFPTQGPKGLYLQFRAGDGSVSPVYKQVIEILPFPNRDEEGFVINGGELISPTRHLVITLVPPANAYQWRIVLDQENIFNVPWRTLVPSAIFSVLEPGEKTILVQYRDAQYNDSGVYSRTILVQPFPPEVGRLNINNGEDISFSRTVRLNITPPPNATAMAVRERFPGNNGFITTPIWQTVLPEVPFTFSAGVGAKTIEVLFLDPSLDQSATITDTIFYDPFPLGSASLTINGGSIATSNNEVLVQLVIPPAAKAMRIANSTFELQSMPFINLQSSLSWTLAAGLGPHKVYVQFQTPEGDLSPIYFDEIEVIAPLIVTTGSAVSTATTTNSTQYIGTATNLTVATSTSTASTPSTTNGTSTDSTASTTSGTSTESTTGTTSGTSTESTTGTTSGTSTESTASTASGTNTSSGSSLSTVTSTSTSSGTSSGSSFP